MSILIKGMEMPTTCSQCPLYKDDQYEYCGFGVRKIPKSIGFKPIRPDWCPLVEIPPHGALIDRMALLESIKETRKKQPEIEDVYTEDYFIVAEWLMSAPTIIGAEDGI